MKLYRVLHRMTGAADMLTVVSLIAIALIDLIKN